MPSISFATFMIICPTSFFLGLVFSSFPYDYPLLWSSNPIAPEHLTNFETHLHLIHDSPNLIIRIMSIITGLGLLGLIIKLYKPSESNMLFDGGSLVLYMISVIVFLTNTLKGLRIVDEGAYGVGLSSLDQDRLDDIDSAGFDAETGYSVLGREDNLKVLAATNTILALVLMGVLVLQFGQWYAERVEERERAKFLAEQKKTGSAGDKSAGGASSATDGTHVTRNASKKKQ